MKKTTVAIFADGKGENPLAKINFKPMLEYTLSTAEALSDKKPVIITENEEVKAYAGDRADTVSELPETEGTVIALKYNIPLITAETVESAFSFHTENENDVTVVTAKDSDEITLCIAEGGKIRKKLPPDPGHDNLISQRAQQLLSVEPQFPPAFC